MFDALTFKPACDDPSVVRYFAGGGIRAATPARLVAEITSPTFVDYDLLSDFFLSYRSFLDTTDLLYMLIARLKWALARDDETGTVVRVRTFVAIRHWILNYFLDDYVVDYDLRTSFCDLLNGFVDELCQNPVRAKVPLKILAELKKCWRRVCALYWDGPEFEVDLPSNVPISPGGVAGSRNPDLDPTFWQSHPDGPPRLDGIIEPDFAEEANTPGSEKNFFADVSRAGHLDLVVVPQHESNGPEIEPAQDEARPPSSVFSDDVVSCSFPYRQRAGPAQPLGAGAHPVPASSIYEMLPHIATTPKALHGKRIRPAHAHKRSASFSDSYRDRRAQQQDNRLQQPVRKVIYKSTELFLTLPYAGSIVRGNLFPPGQAFVDVVAPSTPADINRATSLFPGIPMGQKDPSAMSGPGMKRLLGSVRRALSTKTGGPGGVTNASPTQGSFPNIPPLGVRGATINRLPGTAIVPQARSLKAGIPMRIDLLGAEVAEDFKKAVREDTEAEARAEARAQADNRISEGEELLAGLQYSSMAPETTLEQSEPTNRIELASQMTKSSKSTIIADDAPELATKIDSHAHRPSEENAQNVAQDTYAHPPGGLTPPSTPPSVNPGSPTQSFLLLDDDDAIRRSHSFEGTPSLVVDSWPSGEDERSPSHRPPGRLGMSNQKGLSYRTTGSSAMRRYASFHCGYTQRRSERSFDATTFSGSEGPDRISHTPSIPLPLRVLRRRPGGDLRAVSNVGDLNVQQLQRPASAGTAYSESVRSSYLLGRHSSVNYSHSDCDGTEIGGKTYSLGALADTPKPQHVSLFSTHSSQPIMRPSFEKEAQILARIPDDDDDDGGVESALLKLEGKFEKRCSDLSGSLEPLRGVPVGHNSFGQSPCDMSTLSLGEEEERQHLQGHGIELDSNPTATPVAAYRPQQRRTPEELQPTVYQPRGMQPEPPPVSPRSVESYNSIPLLERGFTDDGYTRNNRNWSINSAYRVPSTERRQGDIHTPESSHANSFDLVDETDSTRKSGGETTSPSLGHSFLDDDSDDSDLSSELSLEIVSRTEYTEPDHSCAAEDILLMGPGMAMKKTALSHPLRQPPSPPMAIGPALKHASPQPAPRRLHEQKSNSAYPPTPEITPGGVYPVEGFGVHRGAFPLDHLRLHISEPSRKTSVHLPFTMAFDSQVLAQQFTLIEKDALNEIDWKDLIEMRWKDASTDSRSWVEFLRQQEPRGVEVVMARFNLMVKWAVSECVLTQDIGERARCIIKFIHIAAHCRTYRNFATMTQLTVALTSKDISCLTKTWSHVPAADKETLNQLEMLVTPTHNFHNLRAEMEGAGAGQGCIPFVGIYTHDLLINSERPSQIASTPTAEPLVNFERCRTDATIVKNLLRLLEASSLYRFQPIEGITERCLWMAALTDEEIARYVRALQE